MFILFTCDSKTNLLQLSRVISLRLSCPEQVSRAGKAGLVRLFSVAKCQCTADAEIKVPSVENPELTNLLPDPA